MKTTALFLLAFILLGCGLLHGQQSGPAPYPDPNNASAWPGKGPVRWFDWMTANRKSFWARRTGDAGKILFVGDSIIGGWKLEKDFPGKPVVNRGIGGEVSRGLLFRFQEDVLDLKPKAIVIHIGANDLSADGPIDGIVSNYNLLLDQARTACPGTPVVVLAVLPHGIPTGPKAPGAGLAAYLQKVNARIPLLNEQLAKLAESKKDVVFVDSYSPFLLPDGSLDESLFNADKVHPTDAGHTKLAGVVDKALSDLHLY